MASCELCALARTTPWYAEYDEPFRFVILDCDSCDVPMAVFGAHESAPSPEARAVMQQALARIADTKYPRGWFFDDHMRQIPEHYHVHARPYPAWWPRAVRGVLLLIGGVTLLIAACASGQQIALSAPGGDGWMPFTVPLIHRHTTYTPVELEGVAAVRAQSECSASALILPLAHIDVRETPWLQWRWKVEQGLTIGNERVKAGDDFAARVYVMFRFEPERASVLERLHHRVLTTLYGRDVPGAVINYLWTNHEPAGAHWDNPYTSVSKMLALESGTATDWKTERVDVVADYEALFQHAPPPLLALALMTDSDNSCQRAVADFGDFRFESR